MGHHIKFFWSDNGITNDIIVVHSIFDVFEVIDRRTAQSNYDILKITVHGCSESTEQNPYVSNICGKIYHNSRDIVREQVAHMQHVANNGFGDFKCFYSPLCNLTIVNSGILTLFRGARSSEDVMTVVEHVLDPQTITEKSIHMIVASARLPYSISVQDYELQRTLLDNSRWAGDIVSTISDNWQTVRSYRLRDFDTLWLNSLNTSDKYCREILVNITCKGSVNMFMSMHEQANFYEGVEKEVMWIFEYLFQTIKDSS